MCKQFLLRGFKKATKTPTLSKGGSSSTASLLPKREKAIQENYFRSPRAAGLAALIHLLILTHPKNPLGLLSSGSR